jgi:DNA-binding response OmpR family regulator
MHTAPRFLVFEDDPDGQFLIRRVLLREFPEAEICVFHDASVAFAAAQTGSWAGCIVHRALDLDALEIIRRLRREHPALTIVAMSGAVDGGEARAAGASHFSGYDGWRQLAACFKPARTGGETPRGDTATGAPPCAP